MQCFIKAYFYLVNFLGFSSRISNFIIIKLLLIIFSQYLQHFLHNYIRHGSRKISTSVNGSCLISEFTKNAGSIS